MSAIPASALPNLHTWKHKSDATQWIDRVVMNRFWEYVATLMPRQLAPNMITFIGNIGNLLGAVLVLVMCPTFYEPPPSWLYFTLALLAFSWQTLDAVDGKHARKIGLQSPLGALFDHG